MSWEQAATLPVALQTMHNAVVTAGRLKAGESVLIQGASSGVGLMGLQIAKLKGARLVMGSSTNAKRRERLKEFGADLAIDTTEPEWSEKVLAATDKKGVDLIVDQVSASVANQNLKAAAVLGRIVNVGRLGGFKGEFDFDLHAAAHRPHRRRLHAQPECARSTAWCARTCGARSRKAVLPIDKTAALADAVAALAPCAPMPLRQDRAGVSDVPTTAVIGAAKWCGNSGPARTQAPCGGMASARVRRRDDCSRDAS
jgi:NADPH2:quinone reductase